MLKLNDLSDCLKAPEFIWKIEWLEDEGKGCVPPTDSLDGCLQVQETLFLLRWHGERRSIHGYNSHIECESPLRHCIALHCTYRCACVCVLYTCIVAATSPAKPAVSGASWAITRRPVLHTDCRQNNILLSQAQPHRSLGKSEFDSDFI